MDLRPLIFLDSFFSRSLGLDSDGDLVLRTGESGTGNASSREFGSVNCLRGEVGTASVFRGDFGDLGPGETRKGERGRMGDFRDCVGRGDFGACAGRGDFGDCIGRGDFGA